MKTGIKKATKVGKRSNRAKSPKFEPLFMPSNALEAITEENDSEELDPVFEAALDEYIFSLECTNKSYADELEKGKTDENIQELVVVSNIQPQHKVGNRFGCSHHASQILERHKKPSIGQKLYSLCRNEILKVKYERDFIPSEDNSEYHQQIVESSYNQELHRFAKCYFEAQECKLLRNRTVVPEGLNLIIPNDINMWHFDIITNTSDWLYTSNPKQWSKSLPTRWTGQVANFYEPFVIRYKKCDSGRDISFMGLCPYCPVTLEDFTENFNRLFFPLSSKKYEAHLGTVHGVYSSGHEMPCPSFAEKKGVIYASCMECHSAKKMVNVSIHNPQSLLLSYFKHGMKLHCKKRSPPMDPKTSGCQSSHFSPPTSYNFNQC